MSRTRGGTRGPRRRRNETGRPRNIARRHGGGGLGGLRGRCRTFGRKRHGRGYRRRDGFMGRAWRRPRAHRLIVEQYGLGRCVPLLVVVEAARGFETPQRGARVGVPRALPAPAVIAEVRQALLDAPAVGTIERVHVG